VAKIITEGNLGDFFKHSDYEKSGAYHSKEAAINGALWWEDQGYEAYIKKQGNYWYHWTRKK